LIREERYLLDPVEPGFAVVAVEFLESEVTVGVEQGEDVRASPHDLVGVELRVRRFELLDGFRRLHDFVGLGKEVEEERGGVGELDGEGVGVGQRRRFDDLVVARAIKVRVLGPVLEGTGFVPVDMEFHVGGGGQAAVDRRLVLPVVVEAVVQHEGG